MRHKDKVAFFTLGCKLNFSETSTIGRKLPQTKFSQVKFNEFANIYVINTCSVTEKADKEFAYLTRKCLRINPNAFIVAIGCYAQLKPNEISKIKGVDLILGADEKFNLSYYLNTLSKNDLPQTHSCDITQVNTFESSYSLTDRTRTFLKIQDGCDYKCTYCTIPLARGVSRSDSLENIKDKVFEIEKKGVKEIVLTGVNIGDFGKGELGNKKHNYTFETLLEQLEYGNSIERFRISSIEPNLLHDSIIEFVSKSKKFVPHFHIPLQSGSDKLLKWMKRRYLKSLYTKKIKTIKTYMPDACIGVDVIVGFPGETDKEFLETYTYLKNLEVSYLHVFTFSERLNTEAIAMEKSVPMNIRNERSKKLRVLSMKKNRQFYDSQKNQIRSVLFESENVKGFMYGYTDNYLRVKTYWNPDLCNSIHEVKLLDIDVDGIFRVLASNYEQLLNYEIV